MIQFIQGLLLIWKEEWMNILPKEKCAKYTKRHKAKKLEAAWSSEDRKLASKLEYYIKHLPKSEKEDIIKHNKNITVLSEKLDIASYKRIRLKR